MSTIAVPLRTAAGRLWSALVAAWGVFIGLLPHVLHHVGPLAGAAVLAGAGGIALFGAIGLIAGNRNVGLMLAAAGFAVPDLAWLYFALAQFPIYLLPHLLKPLAKRLAANR